MMEFVELLVGIAEIAVALAGFTGVVVVFGSRSAGAWHPGDRLRLGFLLEASLTAGGFSLLALLLLSSIGDTDLTWAVASTAWGLYMVFSLYTSRRRIQQNSDHGDVDRTANLLVAGLFIAVIMLQVANAVVWRQFAPFLAALFLNLAGATMQFARLIRTAFHD